MKTQIPRPGRAPALRTAAVLGAGVMGRAIAAHLANAGLEVLLLDLPGGDPSAEEAARGLSADSPEVRSRLAVSSLAQLPKDSPAPLFDPALARRIRGGNFEDHLADLAKVDWIIEVVVERLDIKRSLLAKVAGVAGAETIVSTNTSGLPIDQIAAELPADLRRRFLGTHFFNPPRYMHLLEIIPGPDTDPAVVGSVQAFAEDRLGKGVVLAKDRPNFVANRIGCYGMLRAVELMLEHGLTVESVDALTGRLMGRAKSATFRTADLVGLDVLLHVASNVRDGAQDDPEIDVFTPPAVLTRMVEAGRLGAKSGEGFYKKVRGEGGASTILALDLDSFEYRPKQRQRFPEIDALRSQDDLGERLVGLFHAKGKGAAYAWALLADTLRYAAAVAPEVAEDIVSVDRALRWGFGWDMGPFEIWDRIGLKKVADRLVEGGKTLPKWVQQHLDAGATSFYQTTENGQRESLTLTGEGSEPSPTPHGVLDLRPHPSQGAREIESNGGASLWDLGDGVLGIEFHSKMNSIGGDILSLTQRGVARAETEFDAVVVGNQGKNFSAGANVALLLMAALEGEYDEIDLMIRQFQRMTTGFRKCARPVVTAPFQRTLGGGAEIALHGDHVHASAELYMGLVEAGVGLIPAGAGTKEMYLRMYDALGPEATPQGAAQKAFELIGLAKVSMGAVEARKLGFLREGDTIAMNPDQQIAGAKAHALALADAGYVSPAERSVPVGGENVRALLEVGMYNMLQAGYISEHDRLIGRKLAMILSGGDVAPGTMVTESHLLELERQAFLSLCGERKSLERIQHILKTGKPLRN